jgi:cyanophycin synthetase
MLLRKVLALRGPNLWADFPVLEAWVDLLDLNEVPSDAIPGFTRRLTAWLPSLAQHQCVVGRDALLEQLERGTDVAHALEHAMLELQVLAGADVRFSRTRPSSTPGVCRVAVQYEEETLARACLEAALRLCLAAVHDGPFDPEAEIKALRELAGRTCLGPSTRAIVRAAEARGIPARRLIPLGSLVQLGQGSRQRRIRTAETDRTGAIAESIAQDKDLTKDLLRAVGVPVPEGRPVVDADDAWEAAREIGGPVVVKPRAGNHGRAVSTDLSGREPVQDAFRAAAAEGGEVLVERFAPGAEHRLLVVGGRVVAAVRGNPAQVVGDGRQTIALLIEEQLNCDPRRGDDSGCPLSKVEIDPPVRLLLQQQGVTPDSVPPAGTRVLIQRNGNLAIDVTDQVHPEVAARAVEAAGVVGLDIAGIDVVAEQIDRPLEEQGGVVVEVNAGPGLQMHLNPSVGRPRPVGEAIIASLFPDGQTGRIPLVGVTGVNGKTTVARLIAHILRQAGHCVGMTCTDGVYVDGRRIEAGDCSGPQSAGAILMNPAVEAAVLETARGGILRAGLGFDRCDVAVVTNIGEGDHLGLAEIETPEDLARLKRTLVEAVLPGGAAVLKADDPLTAAMAPHCPGQVVFFARDGGHPVIAAHRAAGGRAVFVRHGAIVLADAEREEVLSPLAGVPLTLDGRIGFQVENALAAAAAAWVLDLSPETVRAGLASFDSDWEKLPGRFNLLEIGGATVIVDYGHNPSALTALIEALASFPNGQRMVVYSGIGDRRDVDMIRQGEMLGEAFDRVLLYEDHYTRGRPEGQTMALLRRGLAAGTRVRAVEEFLGSLKAVEAALQVIGPGDLLLVQADVVEETLDCVRRHLAARSPQPVTCEAGSCEGQAADDVVPTSAGDRIG